MYINDKTKEIAKIVFWPKEKDNLSLTKNTVKQVLRDCLEARGLEILSGRVNDQFAEATVTYPVGSDLATLANDVKKVSEEILLEALNLEKGFWSEDIGLTYFIPQSVQEKAEVKKLKFLVTGGAGFIGSNLVDELVALGHEVVVIDNLSTGKREYLNPAAKFYEADICDKEKIEEIFEEEKFDYVYHLAAQIDVRKSMDDPLYDNHANAIGSYNIFKASAETGVKRIIFISTGGALYGDVTEPATENDLVRPVSPYAIHKHTAERYLSLFNETHNLDYSVLRLANVYGPRQYKGGEAGVVSIFVDHALRGKTLMVNGDGQQTRDYVFVGDVVRACLAAVQSEASGIFNIGAGTEHSVLDIVESLHQAIGDRFKHEHAPAKAGEVRRSVLNWKKAKEVLGWEPTVSLQDGIKQTIEWSNRLPANFQRMAIPEVILIQGKKFIDDRGYFNELFKASSIGKGLGYDFSQDNLSLSRRGVVRGLHYQLDPMSQGKLVKVLKGRVWDVAVDVRRNSPTFKQWVGVELSEENDQYFFVPPGFAHGFITLSDEALFLYKCTNEYHKDSERGIRFDDQDLAIPWPEVPEYIVSEKDRILPSFADADLFD